MNGYSHTTHLSDALQLCTQQWKEYLGDVAWSSFENPTLFHFLQFSISWLWTVDQQQLDVKSPNSVRWWIVSAFGRFKNNKAPECSFIFEIIFERKKTFSVLFSFVSRNCFSEHRWRHRVLKASTTFCFVSSFFAGLILYAILRS